MFCTACGDTNWQDLRYCPSCGRDIHPEREAAEPLPDHPHPDQVGYDEEPALGVPSLDPAPTPVRRRRGLMLGAAALAVLLAGGGFAWWRTASGGAEPDDSAFAVAFTGTPAIRWQHTLKDWAPELNCSTASGADDVDGSGCTAGVVTTSDRFVVVQGSHGMDRNLLLGVDKTRGTVAWKRPLASGVDVSCLGDDSRVWCLLTPRSPFDEFQATSATAAREPSRLNVFAVADGKPAGTAQVGTGIHSLLGASGGHAFVGTGAPLVTSEGPAEDGPFTLMKYDGAARQMWASRVAGVSGSNAGGPVRSAGGIDYLLHATTSDGEGLGFRDSDGASRRVAGGNVQMVFRDLPVSRPAKGGTWINGQRLTSDDPVELGWQDRADAPLLTADTNSDVTSVRTSIRADRPPYAVQHTTQGIPMAYCSGALVMLGDPEPGPDSVALRSVDPGSGHVNWSVAVPDPADFAVCGTREVMVNSSANADGAAGHLAGYDSATGRRLWSLTPPPLSQLATADLHSIVLSQMDNQDGSLQQITLIA